MTSFDHQNIVFNKICELQKIPKVTWSHGGYCSFYLSGYDITDFKSCNNHFSYGFFLKEITFSSNVSLTTSAWPVLPLHTSS